MFCDKTSQLLRNRQYILVFTEGSYSKGTSTLYIRCSDEFVAGGFDQ